MIFTIVIEYSFNRRREGLGIASVSTSLAKHSNHGYYINTMKKHNL